MLSRTHLDVNLVVLHAERFLAFLERGVKVEAPVLSARKRVRDEEV